MRSKSGNNSIGPVHAAGHDAKVILFKELVEGIWAPPMEDLLYPKHFSTRAPSTHSQIRPYTHENADVAPAGLARRRVEADPVRRNAAELLQQLAQRIQLLQRPNWRHEQPSRKEMGPMPPRPTRQQTMLDAELVADAADDEIDHVVERLRPRVERRHRRQHDRPGLGARRSGSATASGPAASRAARGSACAAPSGGRRRRGGSGSATGRGRWPRRCPCCTGRRPCRRSGTSRWRCPPGSRGSGGSAAVPGRASGGRPEQRRRVEVDRGRRCGRVRAAKTSTAAGLIDRWTVRPARSSTSSSRTP